jgi:AraC family transcriptional regulator
MLSGLQFSKRPEGGAIDLEILRRKSWPGITAQFMRIAAPATYDFKISDSSNCLALYDLYRTDGETAASGQSRSYAKDLRNKITYLPAGGELGGWCQIEKVGAIAMVAIEQTACTRQSVDLSRIPPQVEFEDPMLRSVLLRFQAILDDPSLDLPGYAETLAELLAFELERVSARLPSQPSARSGLSASQIRLITEYMDSHLAEKTTIAELAARLDLTRFHFIRSFKKAAGVPPHQFMIRRRVERAKELLEDHRVTIAEVAARTGFGSAIQLTRAFRRFVGTTPSSYRRNR